MIQSSVHHYETLRGPVAPCLARTCRCPVRQKQYIDIANMKQFQLQIQYDIPLVQKIKKDDRIYFRKCRVLLTKKGLDALVRTKIIDYLYYSKQAYEFGNKYMGQLHRRERENIYSRYRMTNLEIVINYSKYLSLEEKIKALKYKRNLPLPGNPILTSIKERTPPDEHFIITLWNK